MGNVLRSVRILRRPLMVLGCVGLLHAAAGGDTTVLVSASADENDIDGESLYGAVSADGRYVAYATRAANVLTSDANGSVLDVIVRDLEENVSHLVSKTSDGVQADGDSEFPCISADGTRIAFQSISTRLTPDDDDQSISDIFLHDRTTGETTLASVNGDGVKGNGASTAPSMSADGRRIAFLSAASNLDVSVDDDNGRIDVFLRDLTGVAPSTILIGRQPGGALGSSDATGAMVSGDGRFVAFATDSSLLSIDTNTLEDVYLYEVSSGALTLVSHRFADRRSSNGASRNPAIGFDGGRIAFDSSGTNLLEDSMPTRRRVYLYERSTEDIRLVSRSSWNEPADEPSERPSISPDGRYVCFQTAATNLAEADGNGVSDVYLHDTSTGSTRMASVGADGSAGNAEATAILYALAADAGTVVFRSRATGLVAGTSTVKRPRIYARVSAADTIPPTIVCPDQVRADCAGPGGAAVQFTVTAMDDSDPMPTVVASPASGSVFAVGTTTVECTATDAAGNASTCSFEVTVTADQTPPAIECPAPISVSCAGPEGGRVQFTVTVTDECDPSPRVVASPASGSTFPIGTTTVTVTATDASGNSAECTFDVTVGGRVPVFLRGDSNADGKVNISDGVFTLRFLFQAGEAPPCLDAADSNDDGRLNLTDGIYLLRFLFQEGPPIPAPGTRTPGPDETEDDLGCGDDAGC